METANSALWLDYVTFLSAIQVLKINEIYKISKVKIKLINHIIHSFLN